MLSLHSNLVFIYVIYVIIPDYALLNEVLTCTMLKQTNVFQCLSLPSAQGGTDPNFALLQIPTHLNNVFNGQNDRPDHLMYFIGFYILKATQKNHEIFIHGILADGTVQKCVRLEDWVWKFGLSIRLYVYIFVSVTKSLHAQQNIPIP